MAKEELWRIIVLGLVVLLFASSIVFMAYAIIPLMQEEGDEGCQLKGDLQCLEATIGREHVELTLYAREDLTISNVVVDSCAPLEDAMILEKRDESTISVEGCAMGGLAQSVRTGIAITYQANGQQAVLSRGIISGYIEGN